MKASDLGKLSAPFPKEDIHWRAQTVTKDGKKALALAYLDARNVMERLDTVCGVDGWQSEHYDCGGGRMGCKIGILLVWQEDEIRADGQLYGPIEKHRWVWKSDGAGGTDVEADKGAFSDALKRAAVSWGVGRYLYELGNTYVPCEARDTGQKDNWGNIKWRFAKFTDDPWNHVKNADKFTWGGPLSKTQVRDDMNALAERMMSQSLITTGDLLALDEEFANVISQAKTDKPDRWRGYARKKNELMMTLPHGPASANPDDPSTYQE